jgi:hypothetical protein
MSISVSYERSDELQFEAVVFIDDDSGDCWQVQHELADPPGTYGISTGAGAPVADAIIRWQLADGEFQFVLTPRAARLFGGMEVLEFAAVAAGGDDLDAIVERLQQIIGD